MSWTTGMADGRRVAVIIDGSEASAAALRHAASQARQRHALLDVVGLLPADADTQARVTARVRLGEFTRRECPYGTGAPMRLRVECGDLEVLLPLIGEGAELVLSGHPEPPATPGPELGRPAATERRRTAPRHRRWRVFLMHEFQA
jgi:hypothetical protein